MEKEITEIFKKICHAFSISDIDLALSYFSDSPDMVKVSNGNVLRGKQQLAEYWHQNISASTLLKISIDNIKINKIDENHAWTTAIEHISFNSKQYEAIVTNIFVLTSSGWKILMDHTTSIVPE